MNAHRYGVLLDETRLKVISHCLAYRAKQLEQGEKATGKISSQDKTLLSLVRQTNEDIKNVAGAMYREVPGAVVIEGEKESES